MTGRVSKRSSLECTSIIVLLKQDKMKLINIYLCIETGDQDTSVAQARPYSDLMTIDVCVLCNFVRL